MLHPRWPHHQTDFPGGTMKLDPESIVVESFNVSQPDVPFAGGDSVKCSIIHTCATCTVRTWYRVTKGSSPSAGAQRLKY